MENLKALIISDSRPGHENQSIAFCKYKNLNFDIVNVSFKFKFLKLLTYILDFFKIYIKVFSHTHLTLNYGVVISAGSSTYYANKYFSKKYKIKNIAMMYPKGFRKDFWLIFSSFHDCDKEAKNILKLPVNISFINSNHYYTPKNSSVGFIIGGNNKFYKIDENIFIYIDNLKRLFANHEFLLTTSPRTPKFIENRLDSMDFNFKVIFSKNHINPLGDFLRFCDYVFITQDSVSMISESVCNFNANVVILPLKSSSYTKFDKFINYLKDKNAVVFYDEFIKNTTLKTEKIDIKNILKGIEI